jgi:peroxygenase
LATYLMLWPEDGKMRKEDIRRVYDGSIFHQWARDVERKRKAGKMRRW